VARSTVWRIVDPKYAESAFSGIGAEIAGGRFNSKGRRMVYTAGSVSLAMLEQLVQANKRRRLRGHVCIPVTFEETFVEAHDADSLPKGWDARPYRHASQDFGDRWLREQRSLVLCVPSVVVPQEYNYLINPSHPDMGAVEIGDAFLTPFDVHLTRP
jgi:RES domain-containing protein